MAPSVRRHYIPKADRSGHPLGIPTFEDKVAQRTIVMFLEPMYEQDFLPCSYCFRHGRSPHDALSALREGPAEQCHWWVIDADLKTDFDSIPHAWQREILDLRITVGVVRKMIFTWLKASGLEKGTVKRSSTGTPQDGVISPLISHIVLHHVLDEWFEAEVRPRLRWRCRLIRYADDFVMAFEDNRNGERVLDVPGKRLGLFGLTLHETRTRYVDIRLAQAKGHDPAATFDFLGFTPVWERSRRGSCVVRQITTKNRFAWAATVVWTWCKRYRYDPVTEQQAHLANVLQGHCQYHGLSGNRKRPGLFRRYLMIAWRRWR